MAGSNSSAGLLAPGDASGYVYAGDGTRLFVECRNDAHPPTHPRVFLSDGILCDGHAWKYLWKDLAPLAPLTQWNYRGHGRSAPPADEARLTIGAHADDLHAIRRALGSPPSVLLGFSMGTQVALECAYRHRRGVAALILCCGSFGRITSTVRGLPVVDMVLPKLIEWAARAPRLAWALWSRMPARATLELAYLTGDLVSGLVEPKDMLPYLEHVAHVDPTMFLRMLRAAGDHSAWDYLPEVDVPTLVVAAENDTFTPPYLARAMAEALPKGELFMVPNATHVALIEHPRVINDRIAEFLRTHGLAA
jgi:pimeloyl-ACP methyl ester carboxylesterase